MKKNFRFAFVGAIALLGAVGISSCSSSSDEVINNPNYDPETNSVKTEFAISLPNYVGASTRQSNVITQAQNPAVFRGMQDLVLIPYDAAVAAESTPWKSKVFTLRAIDASAANGGWDLATQKAKVYKTLDVPVDTKVFMFYGQATVDNTSDFANGKLKAPTSFAGAASSYNFELQPIAGNYTNTSDTKGNAIIAYLQAIRGTTGLESTKLHNLLDNFKPTAASSASIQAAIQNLWNQVIDVTNGFTAADQALVKTSIEGNSTTPNASINTSNVVTLQATDLKGYPANLNLPDGAVTIDWSPSTGPVINGSSGLDVQDLTKIVYPAALYYRANSTIGVSAKDNVSTTYLTTPWESISNTESTTYYTWNGTVSANTRSVALHDQIQYAVGRLDLSIKAAAATLYDRDGTAVTVNTTDGFPVSAVLIGSQKNVGYDFTPTGSIFYTIYDNVMNGTIAAKNDEAVGTNHTLVLETEPGLTEVKVAVEMTNKSGIAFRGKDGTVPVDGKFYLVGSLKIGTGGNATGTRGKIFEQDFITTAALTITQGSDATTLNGGKNTTGLGAAYNVLPDLTVSNLEVAFSVDLSWQGGLTFGVDL